MGEHETGFSRRDLLRTTAFGLAGAVLAGTNGWASFGGERQAAGAGIWLSGKTIAKAGAGYAFPSNARRIVLPLEIGPIDGKPPQQEFAAEYERSTLPALIARARRAGLAVGVYVEALNAGRISRAELTEAEIEQSIYSAYEPDPNASYVNEAGLPKRFAYVAGRVAKLRQTGAISLVADLRYPAFPLLAGAESTRELWVRTLQVDPIDLPAYGPSSIVAKLREAPAPTREATTAFATAALTRWTATMESELRKANLGEFALFERPSTIGGADLERMGYRYRFGELAKATGAKEVWLHVLSPEDVSALSGASAPAALARYSGKIGGVVFETEPLFASFRDRPSGAVLGAAATAPTYLSA